MLECEQKKWEWWAYLLQRTNIDGYGLSRTAATGLSVSLHSIAVATHVVLHFVFSPMTIIVLLMPVLFSGLIHSNCTEGTGR